MTQSEAEEMYSLLDSNICAADDDDFVNTFHPLLKQLKDKLIKAKNENEK